MDEIHECHNESSNILDTSKKIWDQIQDQKGQLEIAVDVNQSLPNELGMEISRMYRHIQNHLHYTCKQLNFQTNHLTIELISKHTDEIQELVNSMNASLSLSPEPAFIEGQIIALSLMKQYFITLQHELNVILSNTENQNPPQHLVAFSGPQSQALLDHEQSVMNQRLQIHLPQRQEIWEYLGQIKQNPTLPALQVIAMIESDLDPEKNYKGLMQFTEMGPFADENIFNQYFNNNEYFSPDIREQVISASNATKRRMQQEAQQINDPAKRAQAIQKANEMRPFKYVHSFKEPRITQNRAFQIFKQRRHEINQSVELSPPVAENYLEIITHRIHKAIDSNNLESPDPQELIIMAYNLGPNGTIHLLRVCRNLGINDVSLNNILAH